MLESEPEPSFSTETIHKAGAALQTASSLINSFNHLLSDPFPTLALQGRQVQMVKSGSSSHRIHYFC